MSSKGWKTYKLQDLCTKIGSGATPRGGKEAYLDDGPYALIRSQNVLDFFFSYDGLAYIDEAQASQLNNVELQENDVLLNITGDSVARVCQVPKALLPARVNQHVSIVRPDSSILIPGYLKYFLLNPKFKSYMLGLASVGGTRNALTKGMIEDFEIDVPPMPTQCRIADILSALDEIIELNRQTNATLEAIVQAIFKEWFMDFNFPGATGELVENELGMIPRGWRVAKLEEISEKITKGTTPTTFGDKFVDHGIRFLRAECIQDDLGIDETKSLFITSDTHDKLKRSQLAENDILITIAGSIGRIGIVIKRILPANLNQAIGIIRLDFNKMPVTYIYYYLKQQAIRNELLSGVTQSVQANISLTDLNNLKIIIPPKCLLEEFDSVTRNNREYLGNLSDQSANISILRDCLLPKLLSGEIEI